MILLLLPMLLPTCILIVGVVLKNNIFLWVAVGAQILMRTLLRQKAINDSNGGKATEAQRPILQAELYSSIIFGGAAVTILVMQLMGYIKL
jgi:hypothetical protein